MLENEDLMIRLMGEQNLSCTMYVDERSYQIHGISISKSKIPVRKPTTRGGVYFTDVEAYKVTTKMDLSIKDEIPKLMLGPNTEFKPVVIKTSLKIDEKDHLIILTAHLTNSVSTQESIDLNLVVDKVGLHI
jgi:hypothetical protein